MLALLRTKTRVARGVQTSSHTNNNLPVEYRHLYRDSPAAYVHAGVRSDRRLFTRPLRDRDAPPDGRFSDGTKSGKSNARPRRRGETCRSSYLTGPGSEAAEEPEYSFCARRVVRKLVFRPRVEGTPSETDSGSSKYNRGVYFFFVFFFLFQRKTDRISTRRSAISFRVQTSASTRCRVIYGAPERPYRFGTEHANPYRSPIAQ